MQSYQKFNKDVWQKINLAIEKTLDQGQLPIAVFDADGTLWNTDLGENFFKWEIKNAVLSNLPKNPWEHYRNLKSQPDPRPAYLWLAQIHSGLPLKTIQNWAQQALKEISPPPIFESQKELIELLYNKSIAVFIVTASVKWAVEPGASLLGVDSEFVLGVETEVQDGLITDKPILPVTYKEGKLEALLKKTKGQNPFLASGNTIGDISLLENATHISLAVGAAQKHDELFQSEENLRALASKSGWIIHHF